jgi:membrane protein
VLSDRAPFGGLSFRGVYGRGWKTFGRDLWSEIYDDNVFDGAAALAYYLTLAIFPALIFLLSLMPYLPIDKLQDTVQAFLAQLLPGDTARMVKDTVNGVLEQKHQGLLSVGAVLTIWAASSGLYSLMQQLNVTYDVKEGRPYWKTRLTAFGLMIGFGLFTLVALALIVAGDSGEKWLAGQTHWGPWLSFGYQAARWLFVATALGFGFAIVYYFGPDVEQRFRFVTPGSVLSVALTLGASLAFKAYVDHFGNYNATYGGIGAVIVLMLWLNILGLVALLGSEVNALLEHYSPEGKEKGEKREPEAA